MTNERIRQELIRLTSYAATALAENTSEWMIGLCVRLNNACEALGEEDRFQVVFNARHIDDVRIEKVIEQ